MNANDILSLPKSEFVQTVMRIKGKPYSLKDYGMFEFIYDLDESVLEILLKAGRQISKSTFNAKRIETDMMTKPFFQALYVCPLKEQTTRFSNNYLGYDMQHTPFIQRYFQDKHVTKNVFSRGMTNGSLCQLTYSLLDAERARGIPSDEVVYDEVQDIPVKNIPVINECLSASEYKFRTYTGTPKTIDNTIEQLWLDSTQCEWVMQCVHCNKLNVPKDPQVFDMIGPKGPICVDCGKVLNVRNGRWTATVHDFKEKPIVGFHIPQIIMPMHAENPKAWNEILKKKRNYSDAQFANECLGLSYDIGGRLVTLSELRELSTGKFYDRFETEMNCPVLFAGIDWGISAASSFTVLVIGGFDYRHRFKVFYAKRFASTDILKQIDEIIETCRRFQVQYIGADVGVGWTNNQILRDRYGMHRVYQFNYCTSRNILNYNERKGFYTLDKTTSLNNLFIAMKTKKIEFFDQERMETFYPDILSIHEELVETPRGLHKVFNHNKNIPDDFTHALNFAMFTAYRVNDDPLTHMSTGHTYTDDEDEFERS